MSKKIVVLTGSPRKNGNSFAMTDAFIEACKVKGCEVSRFDTAFMNVNGCTACQNCFKKEQKACCQNDDFNTIASAIEIADAVVFSCPVYWYGVPSNLKAVIDKFYAFSVGQKIHSMAGKKAALITCWEESGLDVGDGVKFTYLRSVCFLGWNSVGEVAVPGIDQEGDVLRTNGIQQAVKLAELV